MNEPDEPLLDELRRIEQDMEGSLGVAAQRLGGAKEPLRYRAEEAFPAASTIKVFVLQALLERVAAGELELEQERTLGADDRVAGTGVLKALSPGRRYTLRDLATLMIIVSDNTATNLLIDLLGVGGVNRTIERHGWRGSRLAGPLQRPERRLAGAPPSLTTPSDLADYFVRLWSGELLPPAQTALAQAIFRGQQRTDMLGRYLPFDAYSRETGESVLTVASKSGSLRGVRNDAGVIEGEHGAYVIAVMSRDCPDLRFHPENLGAVAVGRVARAVHERFVHEPGRRPRR